MDSDDSRKGSSVEAQATSSQSVTAIDTQTKATSQSASNQPRRELFIRSLPASATTESLAEHFSQSYVIKHAIVVTDPETKLSRGYGFVTFADVEDAKAALEELNGSAFAGKKIKVEYAQPRHRVVDENLGRSKPSTEALELKKRREQQRAAATPPRLIVRNLPWSIKEPNDLAVLFRSYGKVKQAYLPKKGNQLAGFGFVVLRGKKNAEKALEGVNGKEVDGRTLAVDWAVEKNIWEDLQKERDNAESDKQVEEPKDAEIADEDEEAAEADCDVDEDAPSVDGEGDLDSEDDMIEADLESEALSEQEEEEEKEENDERDASTIFIRNLPFTCDDEMLYEHFTQFGPLRYARIVIDRDTERPRGTGFVCFWKADDAVSCVRDAPKQQDPLTADKDKGKRASTAYKQSVLQNENADPSGRYTLDGRVLQVARAVSKSRATQLEEEGVSRRLVRDTDKRRLYLLQEGTIAPNSALYKKLSPSEIKMREDSYKQRQNFIKKNPSLHLSLTRLSIRNIPRHITSKDLKQLARQAVVGFAQDMKNGVRQPLSKEELDRAADAMREAEQQRKKKGVGVVRQAKIVYESRDGSKIKEETGAGRSRGYGFVEYYTHRHALMGLRWLNGHAVEPPKSATPDAQEKKKRLVVEFAIENANVVKRRNEQQSKARNFKKDQGQGDGASRRGVKDKPSQTGQKRKRSDNSSDRNDAGEDAEEQNKVAKRNRIIAKKRMQRRTRKGKA
ncbi:mRNA-binding ribosome biosynthesis protein NOP4 [Aspergillus saccharolyticus JOP 1030-1]|uniref:RNA-binding domain-containing protein n=1 Tax=Aspergillus saccharolyticus JOP 1030-1 TaxID=1450539 RepID=A0A318Z624_9EURO|nr:RNA-binding domain-containing protein [Aspergillus saccharolyticus JOP 1030-1]PYH41827.1 RNA-binding domain-containing protein [Aspergillus saccharolyticus JOP 1030-1]